MSTAVVARARGVGEPTANADGPEARLGWALSPGGSVAACKVLTARGDLVLELRYPFTDRPRLRCAIEGLAPHTPIFPHEDGSVVVGDGAGCPIGALTMSGVWTPWNGRVPAGARLVRGPGMSLDAYRAGAGVTVISRHRPDAVEELARLPYRSLGGHAVGESVLVVNVIGQSGHTGAVRVDLPSGAVEHFYCVSERSDDRVAAIAGDTVVVTTTASGEPRLGWGTLRENRIRFPEAGSSDRAMSLAALSGDGTRAVFVEDRGLTMPLRLVDLRTDSWRELARPPLVLAGPGSIRDDRFLVPVGDVNHPGTLLQIELGGTAELRHDDPAARSAQPTMVAQVPGPGGPIEVLVIGDLETAHRAVVALHGGPFAAWRSAHHPLFETLAAGGVAVVAPNIRGSIGYGRPHAHAIRDRWGEVDAADVRAVRRWVAERRGVGVVPPVLVGESYGAYLAMVVAASGPSGSWSGCAALSGFTSGARIADLGTPVSELVRRFGGDTSPDLLTQGTKVPVPVLLIHGDQDDVVPVQESVDLAASLAAAGVAVAFDRDPAAGHDLMASPHGWRHRRRLLSFVLDPGTAQTNARAICERG